MKKISTILVLCILSITISYSQLSITNNNTSYTIDFESTLSGVNNGSFLGAGFTTNPTNGQLDTDAWATTGFSDGSKNFGINNTSGDHARGSNNGGVSTGGVYGFDVGGGNRALAFQATGGDWTPGTITLKLINNSASTITEMNIDYNIYVRNDQNRSNTFNLSISYNDSSYSGITSSNYASPQASSGTNWIITPRNIVLSSLDIAPGEDFYIRWAGSDAGGSGSRDEFALDDIVIGVGGATGGCTEPLAQATNLNFGTVTSNSIQASFTASDAAKYLVVQSTSTTLGASPTDGYLYNAGSTLGNGEVIQYSNSTNINSLGLASSTTYNFFIFAANDNCTNGPNYLSTNPLLGSATTSGGGTDYYSGIGSETCENLKTALHNLIDNHTVVSYSSLWTHYQTTDDHLNDNGNEIIVWDMYSDNPTGAENEFTFVAEQCGGYQAEGDCYNREHSFPKSWWGGSTSAPQYTDIFTVVPVDGWINGIRSNNPYGQIQSGTETHITNNGTALGSSSISIPGYSGSVFEPIDAYKGDLARGYFYMATRYEDVIATWENSTTEANAVLDGTSFPVYEQWMIDMLLDWHNSDPVDIKEIERNEAIFGIQGNRNPFIDHPEYASLIWESCGTGGDTEAPSSPTNLSASNITQSSTDLSWTASSDNIGVTGYDIYQNGSYLASSASTTFNATGLSAGTNYSFYVQAYDAAGNISSASNTVSVTTGNNADTQAPTAPTNLTASNTTETATDLNWTASSDNVGVTGYNIYQDGSYLANTAGTSINVASLSGGTSYSFYVVAFDAAGNISGSSNTVSVTTNTAADTEAPSNPTNLTASNTTETATELSWNASTDNVGVTGYDVYQDGSYVASSAGTSINITTLNAGTSYDFYVVAFDAAANVSTASNIVSVTTDSPPSNNELLGSYFETGWDGWSDGGSDCARYSGSLSFEGTQSIRIRDNSGVASSMTSPFMDFTPHTSVNVQFSFYAKSMENNEDFWLRYYDGSSWQTIATYVRGQDFSNNTFYTFDITLDSSNYNFSTNSRIRFQCDASGNNDQIYIDAVIVTGGSNGNFISGNENTETLSMVKIDEPVLTVEAINEFIVQPETLSTFSKLNIYPNPTRDNVTLELDGNLNENLEIAIYNTVGQKVDQFSILPTQQTIERDLSYLSDGMYILRYRNQANEVKTERIYLLR